MQSEPPPDDRPRQPQGRFGRGWRPARGTLIGFSVGAATIPVFMVAFETYQGSVPGELAFGLAVSFLVLAGPVWFGAVGLILGVSGSARSGSLRSIFTGFGTGGLIAYAGIVAFGGGLQGAGYPLAVGWFTLAILVGLGLGRLIGRAFLSHRGRRRPA